MGVCKFCSEDAGFLRTQHRLCKNAHAQGLAAYKKLASETAAVRVASQPVLVSADDFKQKTAVIAKSGFLSAQESKEMAVAGWGDALASALDDELLSQQEQEKLTTAVDVLGIAKDDLETAGHWHLLIEAITLREIDEGIIPQRIDVEGRLPFNFQKSEQLVWVFQGVDLYEERTRMTYQGGSQGVSIRVARGLYYRTGGFKGERVPITESKHIDTGMLAVTTKHVYFSGARKSFRLRYDKIIEIRAFEDGLRMQRDARTAKPMIFYLNNVWFAINLISKLAARV